MKDLHVFLLSALASSSLQRGSLLKAACMCHVLRRPADYNLFCHGSVHVLCVAALCAAHGPWCATLHLCWLDVTSFYGVSWAAFCRPKWGARPSHDAACIFPQPCSLSNQECGLQHQLLWRQCWHPHLAVHGSAGCKQHLWCLHRHLPHRQPVLHRAGRCGPVAAETWWGLWHSATSPLAWQATLHGQPKLGCLCHSGWMDGNRQPCMPAVCDGRRHVPGQ